MILVDKDIKDFVSRNELIVVGYKEENLNSISYDLSMDAVCDENGKVCTKYELAPGEVVFVKTQEKLKIPKNILGRIVEKNSRMRQGLVVNGPHYQPGHETYAFLRVINISKNIIELSKGAKIAQIVFEQLSQEPNVTYDKQPGASYQNEIQYKGLGNYKQEYDKQTKQQIEKAKEDIDNVSQKIYANVLTLMGVLVAIFSLISINYQAFEKAQITPQYVLIMNLSMTLCIVIMLGLILIFINKAKSKKFLWLYIGFLIFLIVAIVIICAKFCI